MSGRGLPGDDLVRALPLPLARLLRRALNERDPLKRHQAAYFLWEAAVKLLASAAVLTYAESGPADPRLDERLGSLARPALGHWWEFVALLVPALAERGRPGFDAARKVLFGKPSGARQAAGELDAALREALGEGRGSRSPVRLRDLFDRLVAYRNREIGHGAVGQKAPAFYERMADLLLAALGEILGELDVLAGGRLVYVGRVWRHRTGDWLIARDDLTGESVRRIETVSRPPAEAARLPQADCLCLEPAGGEAGPLLPLWPLLVYDAEAGHVLFFNSQRGPRRTDYLCYTTGHVVTRDEPAAEPGSALGRILGGGAAARAAPAEERASPAGLPGEPPGSSRRVGRGGQAPPLASPLAATGADQEAGPGGMRVTFSVTAGPGRGQQFTFAGHDTFLVGRSRRANFQLPAEDDSISRMHFLVEVNPPHCRLTDLGTKNGTTVNGRRVATADLHGGDEIGVGQTRLRVSVEGHESAAAPPAAAASAVVTRALAPPPRRPAGAGCPVCGGAVPAGSAVLRLPQLCPACRALALGLVQPVPGYFLLRERGRGDLGSLYLAVRGADCLPVTLRLLRPPGGTRAQVARFLREAGRFAGLDHPHVLALRDLGESAGHLYFVSDPVRGTDVAALLRAQGPLPPGRAVRLACQALEALAHAHGRGLVHGGLGPDNVLLEGDDTVRLADFGLARTYQASPLSGLTMRGDLGGSATFLAPEQLTRLQELRPAVDQYAAAALLYHLLTGRLVHDLPKALHRQLLVLLQEEPVPIEKRRPDLPRPLAEVVHRALARDPAVRYPDAEALRRALLPFAG